MGPQNTELRSKPVHRLEQLLDERRVLAVAWGDLADRDLDPGKEPFNSRRIHIVSGVQIASLLVDEARCFSR